MKTSQIFIPLESSVKKRKHLWLWQAVRFLTQNVTPRMKFRREFAIFSLGFMLFISGCATFPQKEMSEARVALKEARLAGAPLYSAEHYQEAKSSYELASSQAKRKKYKEAKLSVLEAKTKAELALKLARRNKALAKEAAKEAIFDAEDAWSSSINEEYAKKFTPEELGSIRLTLAEAEQSFQEEDYFLARDKGLLALENIQKIASIIDAKVIEEKQRKEALIKEAKLKKEEEMEKRYPSHYVVAKGEKLWLIAKHKKIYNDPYQWPLIYKANRDQIKGPHFIYPGQVLKIPRNASIEEIKQARAKAGAAYPSIIPEGVFVPSMMK
jgi:nucleoid-associated protein YgaU